MLTKSVKYALAYYLQQNFTKKCSCFPDCCHLNTVGYTQWVHLFKWARKRHAKMTNISLSQLKPLLIL